MAKPSCSRADSCRYCEFSKITFEFTERAIEQRLNHNAKVEIYTHLIGQFADLVIVAGITIGSNGAPWIRVYGFLTIGYGIISASLLIKEMVERVSIDKNWFQNL